MLPILYKIKKYNLFLYIYNYTIEIIIINYNFNIVIVHHYLKYSIFFLGLFFGFIMLPNFVVYHQVTDCQSETLSASSKILKVII